MFMVRKLNLYRRKIVMLAVLVALVQAYALYMSTEHMFHGAMPLCPVCVAVESYDDTVVASKLVLIVDPSFISPLRNYVSYSGNTVALAYSSRAPPVLS